MIKYTEHVHHLIVSDAQALRSQYEQLQSKLDLRFSADKWISRSATASLQQIDDILAAIELLKDPTAIRQSRQPHAVSLEKMLAASDWQDEDVSEAVRLWRKNLNIARYESIPEADRKEIVDYFFRHDLYGRLQDDSTLHLSRGVNAPEYFIPPAIVKVAVETASLNNWFGYSDSLGYIDTRKAIAQLEQHRRSQSNISEKNAAVLQGGTAGLHAVLSMIALRKKGGSCIVAAPNYSPIIDDVAHHFVPKLTALSKDYQFDKNELLSQAEASDTAVVLLSIPHNPAGFRDFIDILPELHRACEKNNAYLVVDEIIYDEKLSPLLDPLRYSNLVLISSYSKTYNIPGLKLGHLLANEGFVNQFYRHASTTYGSPPSFLYFTATCLMMFERGNRLQEKVLLPEVVHEQTSDPSLLFDEFCLWQKVAALHKKFQKHAVDILLNQNRTVGVDKVYGLDDPSPNIVLRSKISRPAYSTSLDLLATHNISVMPIECFSPPKTWPNDLRVTISLSPLEMVSGFSELVGFLDRRFAWESPESGLTPEDKYILTEYGGYEEREHNHLQAEPEKARQTVIDVFNLASKEPSAEIVRSVMLMGLANAWDASPQNPRMRKLANTLGITDDADKGDAGLKLTDAICPDLPKEVWENLKAYFNVLNNPNAPKTKASVLMRLVNDLATLSSRFFESCEKVDDLFKSSRSALTEQDKDLIRAAIEQYGQPRIIA